MIANTRSCRGKKKDRKKPLDRLLFGSFSEITQASSEDRQQTLCAAVFRQNRTTTRVVSARRIAYVSAHSGGAQARLSLGPFWFAWCPPVSTAEIPARCIGQRAQGQRWPRLFHRQKVRSTDYAAALSAGPACECFLDLATKT